MAAPTLEGLDVGKYLKIVSKGAVYNNLSEDSPMWDYIKKKKKGPDEGRELRYLIRDSYGSSSARFLKVDGGAYPKNKKSGIKEGLAHYKDFGLTVEVERTLISRALSDFSQYGEPLAEELRAKTIAMSRVLSASLYGDGTGVIGQYSSGTGADTTSSITVTLNSASSARGFVGWFEPGDKVTVRTNAGAANAPATTGGTYDHFEVTARDRANDTVTLEPRTAAGAALTFNGAYTPNATDFIYRGTDAEIDTDAVITIPDILNDFGSNDYKTASDYWVGLDTLSQDDGRVANSITLSGTCGGTRRDAGGNPIDSQDFQQLMSQVMIAVGTSRYKYSMAMMAWETLDALIESREVDRRFNSIQDNKRGTSALGYVHGKNTLMFEADEFCPKQRIYCVPEGDVLQWYGSDFEFVKPEGGNKFHLKPNASGYDRSIQAFMEGQGCLVTPHAAGIGVIENFTV